jgi:8-oxo-dGTP pyrophosphatase MutT (NUDIX family)
MKYSFPYVEDDPQRYEALTSSSYRFHLQGRSKQCGYIPGWVVEKMPWTSGWEIDHVNKRVDLNPAGSTPSDLNKIIAQTLLKAKQDGVFRVLQGWRNELYPVLRSSREQEQVTMDRAGSPLFGIVTYGVHMTAYTKEDNSIKIWVPRRARHKQTYGGMLDNTVAGGIAAGEEPFECLVREAAEEASLPEDLIRSAARACGMISYFYLRDERAGGETGLFQPEVEFVFDLQVDSDIVPKPCDGEVEGFTLCTVDEIRIALAEGQFKPNCALVMLDFFIRHGFLTAENEEHYIEIVSRIHRKLPFFTA